MTKGVRLANWEKLAIVVWFGVVIKLCWDDYRKYRTHQHWVKRIEREGKQRKPYNYRPLGGVTLKSFRLIELLPEENGALIPHIKLQHSSLLDADISYEALSYCWGDATPLWPVLCVDENSIIYVTRNLFDALMQLRRDHHRRIWVDAICINQRDITERNWQVRLMGDIYRRASQVLVWLGEARDDSELVAPFVTQMLEVKARMKEERLSVVDLDERKREELGIPSSVRFRDPPRASLALISITERAWWRRMWIIQEFLLGEAVLLICGEWSISWTSFSEAYEMIMDLDLGIFGYRPVAYSSQFQLLKTLRDENSMKYSMPLRALIPWTQTALASDPRDFIYALLGLAEDGDKIEVDYSKSIQQIFEEATRQMLLTTPLDLLNLEVAGISGKLEPDWPSWVPQYHVTPPECALAFAGVSPLNATLQSEPDIVCVQSSIELAGYALDTIVEIGYCGPPFPRTPSYLIWKSIEIYIVVANWANVCNAYSGQIYHQTGEDIKDAFWQTFMGPYFQNSYERQKEGFKALEPTIRAMMRVLTIPLPYNSSPFKVIAVILFSWLTFPTNLHQLIYGPDRRPHDPHVLFDFLRCFGRRIVRTESGYIGLGPQAAKVGDEVFLVKGVQYPCILRKALGQGRYYLVGQAFIHGVMSGQLWVPERCKAITLV